MTKPTRKLAAVPAPEDVCARYHRATLEPMKAQLKRTPDDATGYIARHDAARVYPRAGFESALMSLVRGLEEYAAAHEVRYESKLGDDAVLGEAWLDALRGVRGLLNGELGRLDGGFLDGAICNLHREAGFEGEL